MKKVGLGLVILVLLVSFGFNLFMVNYIREEKEKNYTASYLVFPDANSRETIFTMHNIKAAQAVTKGKGVKVGVLDSGFGYKVHPKLYAGGEDFSGNDNAFLHDEHHGYWMANTLREVAPETEIYALNINFNDEKEKASNLAAAIDWAIANGLDVLTYSSSVFSEENIEVVNEAVDKALANNIVTTFIHYAHPGNILPDGLFTYTWSNDLKREPDLNIFHYDYNTLIVKSYLEYNAADGQQRRKMVPPFLSISSTSPVTAGFVALLKSVRPGLKPKEYKKILMDTSKPVNYQGQECPRVADIYQAVLAAARMAE
ncbi:MAG: S8 family serine peptidase [Halanaerobium sp.]|nr:S8 family serine peptidase [Halanaerobium sp.]